MSKRTKLEKHLAALDDATTGNANDAVTFVGKGLNLLKSLVKSAPMSDLSSDLSSSEASSDSSSSELDTKKVKKNAAPQDSSESMEEEEEDLDKSYTGLSGSSADSSSSMEDEVEKRTVRKNASSTVERANGGYVETASSSDYDEDPAGEKARGHAQFTNHGQKIKANQALKSAGFPYDERRFQKSLKNLEEQNSDVLDASPVMADMSKELRRMSKSVGAGMTELQGSIMVIAKAMEKSLRAQASLAAEVETLKKSAAPATPASGFVMLEKSSKHDAAGKTRVLSKTELSNTLTVAIDDATDPDLKGRLVKSLRQLGSARSEDEIVSVVESLPADMRAKL